MAASLHMDDDEGAPPASGWAVLAPELLVEDLEASLVFWCRLLGFAVAYQRIEERFVYLERPEGAQVMLTQRSVGWDTGCFEHPFGRGIMLQIEVSNVTLISDALEVAGYDVGAGPTEVCRRLGDREGRRSEFRVRDPDGYLLMFGEPMTESRA